MQKLMDDMILYHGSYCEVQNPDLKQCAKYKDFGRGFYLTTSHKEAESFAKISTGKAISNKIASPDQTYGVVSVFKFRHSRELQVKCYPSADEDWLHCVVGHRKQNMFADLVQELKNYDIISGKIANDRTNATITTYMAGVFGKIGEESADRICISLLLPERLQDQFCFRTNEAIACLTFVESEQIWL